MNEWIPVADACKPDRNENCVIWTADHGWQMDEWLGDRWANWQDDEVTHWMRPEAPNA